MDGTKSRLPLPGLAVALAFLALLVALTGTAVAATGGSFLLGKTNKAGATSILQNTGKGPALTLKTKNLHIAPLSVNGNGTKVANLNADKLDGIDSPQFQRRVASTCGVGTAITAIAANGTVTCGANTNGFQTRVTGTCTGTNGVQSVGPDGSVTCSDTSGFQNRVTGTCTGTNAVQSVTAGGGVTCSAGPVWAVVASDGTFVRGSSGVTATRSGTGTYIVRFGFNVRSCAYVASVGGTGTGTPPPDAFATVSSDASNLDGVSITTFNSENTTLPPPTDEPFHLVVIC